MHVIDLVLTTHQMFLGGSHPSSLSVSFLFIGECYAIIGICLLLTSVLCDGMYGLFQLEVRCKVAMIAFTDIFLWSGFPFLPPLGIELSDHRRHDILLHGASCSVLFPIVVLFCSPVSMHENPHCPILPGIW